jgi:hypothetical protein
MTILTLPRKDPVAVLEVQARGLRLVGGDRHGALRDAHLVIQHIVVLESSFEDCASSWIGSFDGAAARRGERRQRCEGQRGDAPRHARGA